MANLSRDDEDLSFGARRSNKPCRACTDFKTWTTNVKQNQQEFKSSNSTQQGMLVSLKIIILLL